MCLSHPRITATFYVKCPVTTLILKPGSALPIALELDFGYRSVIVRGHGQETESARANVLKKNISLLCMAGSTRLQASQE